MQLDTFLELVESPRQNGNGYEARCPAHDDREASLGVSEGEDGKLLIVCRAGCSTEDVLAALDLTWADLFPKSANLAEPEAIYRYTDEQGNELFQAVRFPGKKFRQRHLGEDGEWAWSLDPEVRRVLYRLPEVLAAVKAGETVYVCEGEKDVHALVDAGKVATTNPMGAGKWRPEYAEFLRDANVVIVADRDEPGRAHANTVKESLQGVADGIWVVQAKAGKDAADHLEAGHSVEEFTLVRERVRRGIITAREMAEQALEDLELREVDLPGYTLIDHVPLVFRQGRMYAVAAYTGDGKTCYGLQGTRKLATEGRRGGYFSLEMPERDLRNRLLSHKGIPLRLLEEPWRLRTDAQTHSRYLDAVEEMSHWNIDIVFDAQINAAKVAEITRDREYEFVVIDHVHRFGWGTDRRTLEREITELTNLALEQNIMLLILCQLRRFTRGRDMVVYPKPTLQDFRETEMIGQDASMALAIWRQRDQAGITYTGTTEVIVLKNRHTTGPGDHAGRIFFPHFDTERQLFVEGGGSGT